MIKEDIKALSLENTTLSSVLFGKTIHILSTCKTNGLSLVSTKILFQYCGDLVSRALLSKWFSGEDEVPELLILKCTWKCNRLKSSQDTLKENETKNKFEDLI